MPVAPLSVIIIAPENAPQLAATKKSVAWATEVIVESTDQPIVDFAAARNQALSKATQPWVFFLDSDETVSPELAHEIQTEIARPRADGYYLPRQDVFLGKPLHHGETSKSAVLRLARRELITFERPVHEVAVVRGQTSTLQHSLWHEPHPSLSSFLHKVSRYSDIEANYRRTLGEKFSWFQLLTFPQGKFLVNYLVLGGWQDGWRGFCYALMMSIHSAAVRIKLYERALKQ